MRELKVEMRKLFFQRHFYIAWLIYNGILAFLLYQLCGDGTIVRIEGAEAENVAYNEIMNSMLLLTHQVGLVAIILALLCWQTFGKECDQRYITCYLLSTRDKWKYMLAKVIVVAIGFTVIIVCSIAIMLSIYSILEPTNFSFELSANTWSQLLQQTSIIVLCGILFISLTAVVSLHFGAIGVLVTTIGLAIFSSIFSQNQYIKDFIPLNLLNISKSQSFIEHGGLLLLYILVCLFVLRFVTKRTELGV